MQFLANIDVDDLQKAIEFYQSAFGLKVGRRFGANGVEMLGSTAPIYLLVKAAGTEPTAARAPKASKADVRRYDRHWTPVHLDFVVDDLEPAVQRALDAGARLEAPISTSSWGKLALMADPFGHGFCFVQFLGRGYDEIVE
jgi:predicted enzyme related to lactoylglutathione lyase